MSCRWCGSWHKYFPKGKKTDIQVSCKPWYTLRAVQCLFVVRDRVPIQLALLPAFLLAPVNVRAVLASSPPGENSCLMTFKGTVGNMCPLSHQRLWGRKHPCVSCLFCHPCCSSLLRCWPRLLGSEGSRSSACPRWRNRCCCRGSVCLLILP